VKVLGEEELKAEEGGHSWRALTIHNNRIYTHIGDQTNSTDQEINDTDRKKIFTYALDGSDKKEFASGVRNAEELCVRPGTDEMWGTDHDIDKLFESMEKTAKEWGQPFTDVNPAAEFNHYQEGGFYGHPFILANRLPNPQFLFRQDLVELASKTIVPEFLLPSHSSANGMTFYDHEQFPNAKGDAFIAMRGGWNNSQKKFGYCVQRILFEFGHPYGSQKYVNFLTTSEEVLGRPADVTVDLDGSLLISDDTNNHIYRLRYVGK
jgi:glucose/arabinose dehydrogenase